MGDNVIILAGGQGKRMKTDKPKVLCEVLGIPMLRWVINSCEDAGLENLCIVKGFGAEILDEYLGGKYETVMQHERLGTGHAVMQAEAMLGEYDNILILCGDAPFMDSETITKALNEMLAELKEKEDLVPCMKYGVDFPTFNKMIGLDDIRALEKSFME